MANTRLVRLVVVTPAALGIRLRLLAWLLRFAALLVGIRIEEVKIGLGVHFALPPFGIKVAGAAPEAN